MKNKKILHIKAIGKFNFSFFSPPSSETQEKLHLGNEFWNQIFSEEYLLQFKKPSHRIEYSLEHIYYARQICTRFSQDVITAIDLFFVYQLFQNVLEELSLIFSGWDIHLARGITSQGNGFTAESLDTKICNQEKNNFLYFTLQRLLHGKNISNDMVCVFDIFWPSEIAQAIITSTIIKESYPDAIFILNTENANEQFDFPEYIGNLIQQYYHLFTSIDFITCNKGSLYTLLHQSDTENMKNIFYKKEGKFLYHAAKTFAQDVKEVFLENLAGSEKIQEKIFGLKYVNLRLYPYKCYHSACFFCTINNGNENLFPHKDIENVKEYVEIVLEFIEKNKIENVNFFDEAIHPDILQYFVQRIFEKRLRFIYRFRARYLRIFLEIDFLKKMYDSGARYVGVGLEAASPRINAMVNKGNGDLNLQEKFQVIQNFNTTGIPFHNYSIFGFPQETREETLFTFKFLCNAIEKMDYFTCTPNIYGLMKGSFMYNHPEKFGMQIISDSTKAVGEFMVNGKKRDYQFLNTVTAKINSTQFTKYLPNVDANHFWDFIDRSGIFYHFKVQYKKNPYRYHFEKIQDDIKNHFSELLLSCIPLTSFYRIEVSGGERIIISLISYKDYQLSGIDEQFLEKYSTAMNLGENMNQFGCTIEFIQFLLENFILSNHGEDARSIYNKTM